jgi:Family of unknown function (DUF7009)
MRFLALHRLPMKLRIRGNSVRLRVSRSELTQIERLGRAADAVVFGPQSGLRYGIEVQAGASAARAEFDGPNLRVILPRALVDRWLAPDEVAIEAAQPIGDGEALQILVEKDYTCLAPRSGEDDSDLFPNPGPRAPGDDD